MLYIHNGIFKIQPVYRLNSVYLRGAEPLRLKLLVCRPWPVVPGLEALDKMSWPEHSDLKDWRLWSGVPGSKDTY